MGLWDGYTLNPQVGSSTFTTQTFNVSSHAERVIKKTQPINEYVRKKMPSLSLIACEQALRAKKKIKRRSSFFSRGEPSRRLCHLRDIRIRFLRSHGLWASVEND